MTLRCNTSCDVQTICSLHFLRDILYSICTSFVYIGWGQSCFLSIIHGHCQQATQRRNSLPAMMMGSNLTFFAFPLYFKDIFSIFCSLFILVPIAILTLHSVTKAAINVLPSARTRILLWNNFRSAFCDAAIIVVPWIHTIVTCRQNLRRSFWNAFLLRISLY